MTQDIRWIQRFDNFQAALEQLKAAVLLSMQRSLTDLEKQGLIQSFEFTHELAWMTIKDYFSYQGNTSIMGSRDAAREAFQKGLIENGEIWMDMIKSRNLTSHTYNRSIANDIVEKICKSYFISFNDLNNKFNSLK